MRRAFIILLFTAVAPAAAQSCATLGSQLDCRGAPTRPPANSQPSARPDKKAQGAEVHGSAETTVSSRGTSTTLNNKVIDSHGVVEFGFSASKRAPCRSTGYTALCE